jgi:hypothetical protein
MLQTRNKKEMLYNGSTIRHVLKQLAMELQFIMVQHHFTNFLSGLNPKHQILHNGVDATLPLCYQICVWRILYLIECS